MITRQKLKKWLLIIILGGSAIWLINTIIDIRDEALPGAETFVRTHATVVSQVGMGAHITLRKSIYYSGTPTDPAYREYRFDVKGDKGKIFVIVRAYRTDSTDEPWRYVFAGRN